jgi:hypothetical protein
MDNLWDRWNPLLRDLDLDSYEFTPPSDCEANIGNYEMIGLLNFINLGLTTTRPAAWLIALSTGSPTGAAGAGLPGEPGTASGYSRQTCQWGSATGSTALNVNAVTFGPFSSNCNLSGIGVLDSLATPTIGNPLWFGLLATARNITAGDSLIIAASALTSQVS